jgi:type II secretory pathway component PulF
MRFHYVAFQPNGKVVEGNTDGKDTAEILNFLAKGGLRPISVKPVELTVAKAGNRLFAQKITLSDRIFLTKYLALMLNRHGSFQGH